MTRTIHVYPYGSGWAVKREGSGSRKAYPTQKEAIKTARKIVSELEPSQMIVHGRDGMIRGHMTHGFPKVQDPSVKNSNSLKIRRAVGQMVLQRITSKDPRHD